MEKFPNNLDVQSKTLALFVNIHEIYSDYLTRLLPVMLAAVSQFESEYLYGKFVYVIENCIHDGHFQTLSPYWRNIRNGLRKAREFEVLEKAVKEVLARLQHVGLQ